MTTHRRWRGARALALTALATALLVTAASAQNRNPSGLPSPRLLQISPAGARAGTTVEILVAGRHLEEPEKLVFSHKDVKAELLSEAKAEVDPKTKQPRRRMDAGPADILKFKVTVPANVPVGLLDVRVVGKWGVSNPRAFAIGDLNEVAEKEPNNDVEQSHRVELNTTVNGSMASATDVDYYVVKAAKGQRVVVSCLASSVDSRFLPAIEIYNSSDLQIAANRNYAGADALTDFTATDDGDYYVRLFQFTHTLRQPILGGIPTGANDHFYRLSISTAPWIDAVVPAVVEPGKTATVTVYGRNLPGGKLDPSAHVDDSVLEKATVTVTAPADGRGKLRYSGHVGPAGGFEDGFELRLKNTSGSSNPFLLGLAGAPVVADQGNNDTPETAQQIPLPCEVAGIVEKRRDRDWFTFVAKKGETWNIDVISNRVGSPTYMMILLHNPATKSDIYESPLNENNQRYSRKFFSRSEDPPVYRFVAPADGKYELLVASRAGDTLFGPRHTYTVRITKDDPDFQLVALSAADDTPDSPTLAPGGQDGFTVLINRPDNDTGDVELTVEGLPPGVTCPPQVLNGNVRKTTLIVTAQPGAAAWSGEVRVKGTATINGTKVVREARAASIVWPMQPNQNTPALSRLDRSIWLAVRGKEPPFTLTPVVDKPDLQPGDNAVVKVKVARVWPDLKTPPIQLTLMQSQNRPGSEVPANLRFNNNQPVNINPNQAEVTVNVQVGGDVPPGVYNVVFRGQTQIQYTKDPMSKGPKQNTILVTPSLPLRLSILPKALANLTLGTTSPNVKVGSQAELVVRVQRRYNYTGEFKVQLVLPPGVSGVEASEVTIPANQDEVKLILRTPAQANPGARNNLTVRATAMYSGKPIVHETKFNLNVVK